MSKKYRVKVYAFLDFEEEVIVEDENEALDEVWDLIEQELLSQTTTEIIEIIEGDEDE